MNDVKTNLVGWLMGFLIFLAVVVIPGLYLAGTAVYVGQNGYDKTTKLCTYWWGFNLLQKPVPTSDHCPLVENGPALPKHP